MSEQTSSTTATEETNEQGSEGNEEFQAITTQAEFDNAIQKRIARERAKFPDYDELKAKAEKLKEFEESQKTEEQKRQERDAERDRELADLKAEKLRATVASEKSDPTKGIHVPAELLSGSTREELEASADALIKFKGESAKKPRVIVTSEGNSPSAKKASLADSFNEFRGQFINNE